MKSFKSVMIALVAISVVSFLSSCGGGMKKDIAQKWQMTLSQEQTDTMNAQKTRIEAAMKALDDSIAALSPKDSVKAKDFAGQRDMMKSMMPSADEMDMAKNTVDFKSDGTFEMMMMGTELKGKWELMEADKKLVMMMTNEEGKEKTDTSTIIELTKDKMVIGKDADDKHAMTFIPAGESASTEAEGDKKEGENEQK